VGSSSRFHHVKAPFRVLVGLKQLSRINWGKGNKQSIICEVAKGSPVFEVAVQEYSFDMESSFPTQGTAVVEPLSCTVLAGNTYLAV